jgi:hypothetical protein
VRLLAQFDAAAHPALDSIDSANEPARLTRIGVIADLLTGLVPHLDIEAAMHDQPFRKGQLIVCDSKLRTLNSLAQPWRKLRVRWDDFIQKVGVISHDSMMGRANPSPGLDMTAQWIAGEFEKYGLKPGGDEGSFIQSYHIGEKASDFEASSAQVVGGPTLEFGNDLNFIRAAGTIMVPMNQPLARVVFLLLEPRSDDGLVAWGLLGDSLAGDEPYPVFRAAPGGPFRLP